MVCIYTLILVPSLDSTTVAPQIYPGGKLRCVAPVFEPGGGGISVARAITHLGGSATAIFPTDGATGEYLASSLANKNVPVATVEVKDWTRQNLHAHVEVGSEQYHFVIPGAALDEDELCQLEEQVLEVESGAVLVIGGSLPPGVKLEKLTQLVSTAQKQGIRCTIGSSGETLSVALAVSNIELVKSNQKEFSALVNRELTQPDDAHRTAQEIVNSDKTKRVVVSLSPQGTLGVDSESCVQVVPPPVKSRNTVGAGGSIVDTMTLKLAENASLEEMVHSNVAVGSATTLNQETRLCPHDDTQEVYAYLFR